MEAQMSVPMKEGNRWKHRVMVNGRRVSGSFDTKAAALKWEAHQRVELGSGDVIATTKTLADAFRRYELEVSSKRLPSNVCTA